MKSALTHAMRGIFEPVSRVANYSRYSPRYPHHATFGAVHRSTNQIDTPLQGPGFLIAEAEVRCET